MHTATTTTTMRWAPVPNCWATMVCGIQARAIANVAAGLDRLFGARAAECFGILMYHRAAPLMPGLPPPSINVTPRQFRLQMEGLLRRGFSVWPLRRVLEYHTAGKKIPNQVTVLTFDDGFESFYTHVFPVLKDLNLPATVFLNTAFLDSEAPLPFDHWGQEHVARVEDSTYRCMTRHQCLKLLDEPLIELGAHTHTHQDFRGRPIDFRDDLQTCVDFLKAEFGIEHPTFAFPYGTQHLGFATPDLVAVAQKIGVACALTTESALVTATSNPFQWGRLNVFPWDNGATIAARLHGWYCWAPQLQHRAIRIAQRTLPKLLNTPYQSVALDSSTAVIEQRSVVGGKSQWESKSSGVAVLDLQPPLISVIVPTYNRAHWLGRAIETLASQDTEDAFRMEVIVVDNASVDDTQKVVSDTAAKFVDVPIRYLRQERPGDAPTRNAGVKASRGDWLAFFDDDQLADPHWLFELFEAANVTAAPVIGGPVHLDLPSKQLERLGTICRKALREIAFYPCLHPYVDRDLPGTGNALVARQVFDEVGLFDESFTGGGSDSDLFLRARSAGFELWYTPRAIIRHRIPPERLTREYFRRDALSGGACYAELFDHKQRGALGLAGLCALRVAHAFCVNMPLMVLARMRGDEGEALGRRTLLWRAEGYTRRTLTILAPQWFPQRAFYESLDFRLARTVGQPPAPARNQCKN